MPDRIRLAFLTWGAEDLAAALGARDNKDEQGNYTGPIASPAR